MMVHRVLPASRGIAAFATSIHVPLLTYFPRGEIAAVTLPKTGLSPWLAPCTLFLIPDSSPSGLVRITRMAKHGNTNTTHTEEESVNNVKTGLLVKLEKV